MFNIAWYRDTLLAGAGKFPFVGTLMLVWQECKLRATLKHNKEFLPETDICLKFCHNKNNFVHLFSFWLLGRHHQMPLLCKISTLYNYFRISILSTETSRIKTHGVTFYNFSWCSCLHVLGSSSSVLLLILIRRSTGSFKPMATEAEQLKTSNG